MTAPYLTILGTGSAKYCETDEGDAQGNKEMPSDRRRNCQEYLAE